MPRSFFFFCLFNVFATMIGEIKFYFQWLIHWGCGTSVSISTWMGEPPWMAVHCKSEYVRLCGLWILNCVQIALLCWRTLNPHSNKSLRAQSHIPLALLVPICSPFGSASLISVCDRFPKSFHVAGPRLDRDRRRDEHSHRGRRFWRCWPADGSYAEIWSDRELRGSYATRW